MKEPKNDRYGDPLLTASDIAKRLSISRAMAYRLMQRGLIPTVKLGTVRRVRQEDLAKFIQASIEGLH